jgi:hypothetical protein
MKRIAWIIVIHLLLLFLMTSCQNQYVLNDTATPTYNSSSAVIEGVINDVTSGKTLKLFATQFDESKTLFICEFEITVGEDCEVWKNFNGLKLSARNALKSGQIVQIYVTRVLESYPAQAIAKKVIILEEDPVTLKEPLSNRYPTQFEGIFEEIVSETIFEDKYEKITREYYLIYGSEIGQAGKSMKIRFYFPENAIIWRKVGESYELASIEDVKIGKKIRVLSVTHLTTPIDKGEPWKVIEAVILD